MNLDFVKVNLTRTDLAPTYLTVENQRSRSSIKKVLFENVFLYFENYIYIILKI